MQEKINQTITHTLMNQLTGWNWQKALWVITRSKPKFRKVSMSLLNSRFVKATVHQIWSDSEFRVVTKICKPILTGSWNNRYLTDSTPVGRPPSSICSISRRFLCWKCRTYGCREWRRCRKITAYPFSRKYLPTSVKENKIHYCPTGAE